MKILGENTKLKRIVLSLEHIKDFCGDRPKITSWLGLGPVRGPFCPRRRRSP